MSEQGRPKRLILMRHGQTDWNLQRRFQGRTDIALNEAGLEQARLAAPYVAALKPDVIVSSTLDRAARTAEEVAALLGESVRRDEDLVETHLGVWEGMPSHEIRRDYPDDAHRWGSGDASLRAGGDGETRVEVADRAERAAAKVIAELPEGGTGLIVAHGGTIKALVYRLCGLDISLWSRMSGQNNCSWTILSELKAADAPSYGHVAGLLAPELGATGVDVGGDAEADVVGLRMRIEEYNVNVPARFDPGS